MIMFYLKKDHSLIFKFICLAIQLSDLKADIHQWYIFILLFKKTPSILIVHSIRLFHVKCPKNFEVSGLTLQILLNFGKMLCNMIKACL